MLHSRLRPLPRPPTTATTTTTASTAPPPDFSDQDPDSTPEDPEDLFTSFLPHLFPDDALSFHGDPGQHLLYTSSRYGPLTIMVPSYPEQSEKRSEEVAASEKGSVDEGRKLFAHFLWSAAMVVAEGVEDADGGLNEGRDGGIWRVKGERVLELGAGMSMSPQCPFEIDIRTNEDAGAGLPSLISALAHASSVTITDHPSSPAFSGAIPFNTSTVNIPASNPCEITVQPHEWGTLTTDPWAVANKATYTRIIAADCFWMRSQHENLVRTMRWFLAPGGKVWVVAGFHTGRAIVAGFFETALENGFSIESIYERDLNGQSEDGGEVRREWMPEREGEGLENRKRWCVIAVLTVST